MTTVTWRCNCITEAGQKADNGPSTAAAIAAFCFGERAAILDGNVKRVFCRVFGVEGMPTTTAVDKQLWQLADSLLPKKEIEAYTQGLMDLGATVCVARKPKCPVCPLTKMCRSYPALGTRD